MSGSSQQRTESNDWLQYYPEVQSAGSLRAVVLDTMANLGSPFLPTDSTDWFPKTYARVEAANRFVQVYVAALERLFLMEFWSKGVCLASGNCPDIRQTASAIHQWLSDVKLRVSGLSKDFIWVVPKEGAEAFEEGQEVDWRWEQLVNDEARLPEFRTLVRRAAAEPRLRELFPYSSMHTLCFSRCTGYPFTRDTPSITPIGNGNYRVSDGNDRELGLGDIDLAVRIAVDNLPPGCGPAKPGTAGNEA
ncbi:MAG TPA: DUF6193 family natural product biosynthesis protein [Candidatus Acidoferrum sp.]|nr:DUF6193 family natural product biosynthesis protein [Candidatus Acidoferrum sp.]